jgi:RND family efflux transporter MFP subunit
VTIAGLIVLLAVGGWLARALTRRPAEARVAVTAAQRGEFVISLVAEGPLESDNSVAVRAGKAPGELTMIVHDGTVVKAGDVFCRIQARELQRRQVDAELAYQQATEEIERSRDTAQERYENDQRSLEQAQNDYKVWQDSTSIRIKQAEAQLTFDRAELDRLRTEYRRSQRLADKGYLAASEVEIAKAALDAQQFKVEQSEKDLELSRRQIAAEESQRTSQLKAAQRRTGISQGRIGEMVNHAVQRAEVAKRELDNVTAALNDTTVLAPASGTVSLNSTWRGGERRSWREGDQVSSGTPLGTIASSENMSVRCRIKESNIALLRKGAEAEIEFPALPGRVFPGTVSSVGSVAREVWVWEDPTAEANERVFDVMVKVNQTRPRGLKPGLNARARITVKRLPNALSVPLDAVFERNGKSYVFVQSGHDFLRREVKTGERNDVAVVILSGLSEGELVAMSDPTRAQASARKAS